MIDTLLERARSIRVSATAAPPDAPAPAACPGSRRAPQREARAAALPAGGAQAADEEAPQTPRPGRAIPVVAAYPHHVWAYDFVFDWCENGRQLKFLTVVDDFTRQCLTIEVDHRMGARQVCAVLERLMRAHGVPAFVRSDNARSSSPNVWPGCWR